MIRERIAGLNRTFHRTVKSRQSAGTHEARRTGLASIVEQVHFVDGFILAGFHVGRNSKCNVGSNAGDNARAVKRRLGTARLNGDTGDILLGRTLQFFQLLLTHLFGQEASLLTATLLSFFLTLLFFCNSLFFLNALLLFQALLLLKLALLFFETFLLFELTLFFLESLLFL